MSGNILLGRKYESSQCISSSDSGSVSVILDIDNAILVLTITSFPMYFVLLDSSLSSVLSLASQPPYNLSRSSFF